MSRSFRRTAALTAASLIALVGLVGCGESTSGDEIPGQVVLIAVESMSFERIDPLVEAGELPNLGRLLREGTRAVALAPDPLDANMLWATMLTGTKPIKHQLIGDLVNLPSGSRSLPPSSMRLAKTILQILSDSRLMVAGVGLPTTWPPEIHNGYLVAPTAVPSRWTATAEHDFELEPGVLATYPAHLWSEIEPFVRSIDDLPREEVASLFTLNETEFRMLYDEPLGSILRLDNPPRDVGLTLQRDRSVVDIALHLQKTYSPYFLALHLELLEPLQQVYWYFSRPELYEVPSDSRRRFGGAVDAAYRKVDARIGELIADLPDGSAVCVVSERGFGDLPATAEPGSGLKPQPTNEAVFILWGQGVERGVDLGRVQLTDVTPTLLALMNVHIGADMDGKVLRGALRDEFEAAHPPRALDSHDINWTDEERYPHEVPASVGGESQGEE